MEKPRGFTRNGSNAINQLKFVDFFLGFQIAGGKQPHPLSCPIHLTSSLTRRPESGSSIRVCVCHMPLYPYSKISASALSPSITPLGVQVLLISLLFFFLFLVSFSPCLPLMGKSQK